jgi:hypothetical protein
MMGRQPGARKQLFHSFNLDDHVPANHLLRGVDQFLDLGDLHRHLAPFYSHTGRPSIDPQANKLICRDLRLSEGTVKVHVSAILKAAHSKATRPTRMPLAVTQFELAVKSGDGDFYQVSAVESRLRQLRTEQADLQKTALGRDD